MTGSRTRRYSRDLRFVDHRTTIPCLHSGSWEYREVAQRFDRIAAEWLTQFLEHAHEASRTKPFGGPDEDGVFPVVPGFNILGTASSPPVVLDTNLLRDDVGRVCRGMGRTVLLNAANSGAIRLLCPTHVAVEMVEHAESFSTQLGVASSSFLAVWRSHYLPLLRIVPDVGLDLLTETEVARVTKLRQRDEDDVPAVCLALVAEAFFLSVDGDAVDAVYGGQPTLNFDASGHRRWVDDLKGFGDAHELSGMLEQGAFICRLVLTAGAVATRRLIARPVAGGAVVAAFGMGVRRYLRSTADTRLKMRRAVGTVGGRLLELAAWQQAAETELVALAAPQPSSHELTALASDRRLLRACIRMVARRPESTFSVREIARLLPGAVGRPRGEAKIRQVLRASEAFAQPYPGRFQLGYASADRASPPLDL